MGVPPSTREGSDRLPQKVPSPAQGEHAQNPFPPRRGKVRMGVPPQREKAATASPKVPSPAQGEHTQNPFPLAGGRLGWGVPSGRQPPEFGVYVLQHRVRFFQHLIVPEAQHRVPRGLQPPRPFPVLRGSPLMLPPRPLRLSTGDTDTRNRQCICQPVVDAETCALVGPRRIERQRVLSASVMFLLRWRAPRRD